MHVLRKRDSGEFSMNRLWQLLTRMVALGLMVCAGTTQAQALSCRDVALQVQKQLPHPVNVHELADILHTLNRTHNRALPAKFITKSAARDLGWQPGRDLWAVAALRGRSIGGDRFGNREGRLPFGQWQELDLDYQGGKRNAKRLVFSVSGQRYVTVDHYNSFTPVGACR